MQQQRRYATALGQKEREQTEAAQRAKLASGESFTEPIATPPPPPPATAPEVEIPPAAEPAATEDDVEQAASSDLAPAPESAPESAPEPAPESVAEWLESVKLGGPCFAALKAIGYEDDLEMIIDGDDEELQDIIAAVRAARVGISRISGSVLGFIPGSI